MQMPRNVTELSIPLLERFVVLLYSRTSVAMEVSEAGKQFFSQDSSTLENIPSMKAALEQHFKLATYQANVWDSALVPDLEMLSLCCWGWLKETERWQRLWTTLPEASKSCYELIQCSCKR